jgi:hypothetical protein
MDHPDPLELMVPLVPMEALAPLDPRDPLALMASQVLMEVQETRDHQAPMDPGASQVSAPSTAPPMAESSSRMAQDDKEQDRTLISFDHPQHSSLSYHPLLRATFSFFLAFLRNKLNAIDQNAVAVVIVFYCARFSTLEKGNC